MKFQPTIVLMNEDLERLHAGELKLLRGQWVDVGTGSKSRFVSASKTYIDLIHGRGGRSASSKAFKLKSKMYKTAARLKAAEVPQ